jgi:2-polyprenyl-6-methoxyphenol hydroxylase-like FAD-dependent oxidoreductase
MYDAIIVGARVAGSATALQLGRRGLRVLVVDRATFPSDTLSTHQLYVPAVARLAKWGVLPAILDAGTPPTRTVRFQADGVVLNGRMPTVDGVDMMVSPRRTVLDAVLVDAARTAGAEVREDFTVEELLTEAGRVTGIRGRTKGGRRSPSGRRWSLALMAAGRWSLVPSRRPSTSGWPPRPSRTTRTGREFP